MTANSVGRQILLSEVAVSWLLIICAAYIHLSSLPPPRKHFIFPPHEPLPSPFLVPKSTPQLKLPLRCFLQQLYSDFIVILQRLHSILVSSITTTSAPGTIHFIPSTNHLALPPPYHQPPFNLPRPTPNIPLPPINTF